MRAGTAAEDRGRDLRECRQPAKRKLRSSHFPDTITRRRASTLRIKTGRRLEWHDRLMRGWGFPAAISSSRAPSLAPPWPPARLLAREARTPTEETADGPADLALVNGNILTLDANNTIAGSIAITDGRITAVDADTGWGTPVR